MTRGKILRRKGCQEVGDDSLAFQPCFSIGAFSFLLFNLFCRRLPNPRRDARSGASATRPLDELASSKDNTALASLIMPTPPRLCLNVTSWWLARVTPSRTTPPKPCTGDSVGAWLQEAVEVSARRSLAAKRQLDSSKSVGSPHGRAHEACSAKGCLFVRSIL